MVYGVCMSVRSVGGREFRVSETYDPLDKSARQTCKVCGNVGRRVMQVTMATHLAAEHWNLINEGYFFCFTPTCPIIYYNNTKDIYFSKFDVKTRFGPKESEPPRPICYCLQVTEEQIENEILLKGCCYSLEDIEAYTRAGTGKWCLTTNPSGKCCREYLPVTIGKYLEKARGGPAEKALNKVALLVEEPYQSVELYVDGMTCESCVVAVRTTIEQLGGKNVVVSLAEGKAKAVIPIALKPEQLAQQLSEMGYDTHVRSVKR
jgi:copper chaperone CopZ